MHIAYSGMGGTTDYVLNLIQGDVNGIYHHHLVFYGVEEPSEGTLGRFKHIEGLEISTIVKDRGLDKTALDKLKSTIQESSPIAVTLHVNSLMANIKRYLPKQCQLLFVEHQANHLKSKKEWLWSTLAQRKADKVVCLTEEYQRALQKGVKLLYKSDKNIVIKTGINLEDYGHNFSSSVNKISMISRINDFRDHITLLKAFEQLENSDIELHIAGYGPNLEDLKSQFNKQKIIFHGQLNRKEVIALLGDTDIYVHASLGETSSITIMQAQASCLPIIATDVQGINNVINHENGILVPAKDVQAMKTALKTLIEDHEKRKTLSEASRNYAEENLSHIRMFDNYKAILA